MKKLYRKIFAMLFGVYCKECKCKTNPVYITIRGYHSRIVRACSKCYCKYL